MGPVFWAGWRDRVVFGVFWYSELKYFTEENDHSVKRKRGKRSTPD